MLVSPNHSAHDRQFRTDDQCRETESSNRAKHMTGKAGITTVDRAYTVVHSFTSCAEQHQSDPGQWRVD